MKQKPKRVKRIIFYVPEEQHRQFRAKLALKGKTTADWGREKVKEELASND